MLREKNKLLISISKSCDNTVNGDHCNKFPKTNYHVQRMWIFKSHIFKPTI